MKLKTILRIVSGGLLLAGLFGCGDVEWFPDTSNGTSGGNSPDAFVFTTPVTVTRSQAATATPKTSNIVTMSTSGTNTTGWTVTASDDTAGASTKVSINGGEFTTSGTILPNQTLQVEVTPSTTLNGQVTGRVKVGDYQTTFTVNTVADPVS